jgi:hypothetical protein
LGVLGCREPPPLFGQQQHLHRVIFYAADNPGDDVAVAAVLGE